SNVDVSTIPRKELFFFFSSRRRHTRSKRDWSSDVCSSDLFGNIAHGTSSVICQEMGLRLADYVVNECGFAADLGAEKYFDIVMRSEERRVGKECRYGLSSDH